MSLIILLNFCTRFYNRDIIFAFSLYTNFIEHMAINKDVYLEIIEKKLLYIDKNEEEKPALKLIKNLLNLVKN